MRTRNLFTLTLAAFAIGPLGAIVDGANVARATEVDNFTNRSSLTRDSLPILNEKVNGYLDRAAAAANQESPGECNRMLLRQEFIRWVGPDPVSVLEIWSMTTDEIQRIPTSFQKSIYHDASFSEGPFMLIWGIGRSLLLGGHVVGTDKLGHFFMQGLHYYKKVVDEGMSLDWVLTHEHAEDGMYGLSTTGVKSYGDMSANYQGYRFWSSFYSGDHPYMRCEDGKRWVKAREFNWTDYVTDAWDEAINCSEMVPGLDKKVAKNLAKMGMSCPVDRDKCIALTALDKAEFYVNPKCFVLARDTGGMLPVPPSSGPVVLYPYPTPGVGVPQPIRYTGFQPQTP